jgi:pimeloyl-ACP methyl ester carboxylesterase
VETNYSSRCTMFARVLWFLAFLIVFGAARAQELKPKVIIDRTALAGVPADAIDDYYAKMRTATRRNLPRIIFVPGILGSKIEECQSDGSQCKPIWGTSSSITDKSVDLSIRGDRRYRTDVVDRVFFQDMYGNVLDHIRNEASRIVDDTTNDPILTVFHYDWRVSNATSAERLAKQICEVRAAAPDSPIILIAHSMGGLVSKIWAKRHSQTACSGGMTPRIAHLVFVATPHLGSPKTIKAIAEGYNVLFDELDGLKKYLGFFERNYILPAINAAGMTFPSVYELLPVQTSEYCRNSVPALANVANALEGDDGKSLNVFNAEIWRSYDLLRRIGSPAIRQTFYGGILKTLLQQSERLLCELAGFDPASVVSEVTYLVGREKEDKTYGWFRLKLGADQPIEKFTSTAGDGTVPVYSAQNQLISRSIQTWEAPFNHVGMVSSPLLFSIIGRWYGDAVARTKRELSSANASFQSIVVAETAASGTLQPVSLDARGWATKDNQIAIVINSRALSIMGYSPSEVAALAASRPAPEDRARWYAIAASVATSDIQKITWTGELARWAYASGRFEEAIGSSEQVISATKIEPGKDTAQAANLEKQAKEIMGWSYLRTGDIQRFNVIAKEASLAGLKLKEPDLPRITTHYLAWDRQ